MFNLIGKQVIDKLKVQDSINYEEVLLRIKPNGSIIEAYHGSQGYLLNGIKLTDLEPFYKETQTTAWMDNSSMPRLEHTSGQPTLISVQLLKEPDLSYQEVELKIEVIRRMKNE